MSGLSVLAGPRWGSPEDLASHRRRLGERPRGARELIEMLERSALTGRGGASFPVGSKWRSVAQRARGAAIVVANGAEGEPLSRKDQTVMANRPHLVLDGALLAAESVGARHAVVYAGEAHRHASAALSRAIAERPGHERARLRLVAAPPAYTAGEESAAVHFLNEGVATPLAVPPRPFESGVEGRPTLVQNVETLAHVALIARYGDAWYRSLGREGAAGTVLLTVGGAVRRPGVVEVAAGATVDEVIELAGGADVTPRAVLLGGYFGGWVDAASAGTLQLDPAALRAAGGSLGCGVVNVLGPDRSPLRSTAQVIRHLAEESAAQCGPCYFGLRSIAEAAERLAAWRGQAGDLERLRRWTAMVRGRGACRHPDGAVAFMDSALRVFEAEYAEAAARVAV